MSKRFALFAVVFLALAFNAYAAPFLVSTDRVSYTGTITKYATLEDAQNGTNPTASYSVPARSTAPPYDTAYRDVSFWVTKDVPSIYQDATIFMTAWFYTTDATHGEYSGWGNPNNTNTGFIQIYEDPAASRTNANGFFSNFSGGFYRDFTLQMAGANATYDNAYARLWPAPLLGGAAELSKGTFVSYDLSVTFGGLNGTYGGGWITANSQPDSVSGTFTSIFQNQSVTGPQYNGFYVTEFTFGMDNWAFGQGTALNGEFYASDFRSQVPEPTTLMLLGFGLIGVAVVRRKR